MPGGQGAPQLAPHDEQQRVAQRQRYGAGDEGGESGHSRADRQRDGQRHGSCGGQSSCGDEAGPVREEGGEPPRERHRHEVPDGGQHEHPQRGVACERVAVGGGQQHVGAHADHPPCLPEPQPQQTPAGKTRMCVILPFRTHRSPFPPSLRGFKPSKTGGGAQAGICI